MTFDWREYLYLADNLHSNCDTFSNKEACFRAAISRGYYAAFCTARNCAINRDTLTLSGPTVHRDVRFFYKNSGDRKKEQVGNWLRRLKDFREMADYEDVFNESLESSSEAVIKTAERVFRNLEQIYPK